FLRKRHTEMTKYFILLMSVCLLGSCLKENESVGNREQFEIDINLIEEYLETNNLTAQSSNSGLHYIIEEEGPGDAPGISDIVVVRLKQSLLDGTVINEIVGDSSVTIGIPALLPGLQESLLLLKKGGKGTFLMPSYLGLGNAASADIPANSVLIFELELVDILTTERILEIDIETIENYLEENNIEADSTDQGIFYFFEEEGEGENVPSGATVTVKYKGYFLNGTVFDETEGDATATFPLSGVIRGWQLGIPLFKKGGKGTIFLPSALAYGPSGNASIPPNTVLAFDIEVIEFQ
ncbi:MAG: FKBP-type peptidyl-prolyl cis-trans isomerase, partial [Bacteroidota bacterium]